MTKKKEVTDWTHTTICVQRASQIDAYFFSLFHETKREVKILHNFTHVQYVILKTSFSPPVSRLISVFALLILLMNPPLIIGSFSGDTMRQPFYFRRLIILISKSDQQTSYFHETNK